MPTRHPEIKPGAAFHSVCIAVVYLGLYWGHGQTPDLPVERAPSIIFGLIMQLSTQQQYPLLGILFFPIPCSVAFVSTICIPRLLKWAAPSNNTNDTLNLVDVVKAVLFPAFAVFISYWLFLPLEFTPLFLVLLLSAMAFVIAFVRHHYGIGIDTEAIENMHHVQAIEYLKLKNKDAGALLTLSLGTGISLIITLLVGSVTFYYNGVLRYGVDDPRGLFPLYQACVVVLLAGLIMIEIAFELSYRFYCQMTLCTEAVKSISWHETTDVNTKSANPKSRRKRAAKKRDQADAETAEDRN